MGGLAQAAAPALGYELLIGRLSRAVARAFLDWLDPAPGQAWLDVGCGTGALAAAIVDHARPVRVVGIDPDPAAIAEANHRLRRGHCEFHIAAADRLPATGQEFDLAATGLVLNLVPDPAKMLTEMHRVTKAGGTVAAYVWDFAGRMQVLRHFWDAAIELDPAAEARDQGALYPLCRPHRLRALFEEASFRSVAVRAIEVPARYESFAEYWEAIESGQGRPSDYVATLDRRRRAGLRESLERRLPAGPDGAITLIARAWAVAGERA